MTSPVAKFVLPQFGIFAQGTHAHYFLEFDLRPGVVAGAATCPSGRLRAPDVAAGGVNLVWLRCRLPGVPSRPTAPADLAPFSAVQGPDGRPRAGRAARCLALDQRREPDVILEQRAGSGAGGPRHGSPSPRSSRRSPTSGAATRPGFVDGTANPPVRVAADAALVPPGAPGAGGSHVLAMRWVHDLDAFAAWPAAEQELVIGRTKPDTIELAERLMPPTAHIARTQIDDGRPRTPDLPAQRSVRHRRRARALFHRLQRRPPPLDRMLARMFGTSGDGVHDRLLDFSRRRRRHLLRAVAQRTRRGRRAGRPVVLMRRSKTGGGSGEAARRGHHRRHVRS